MLEIYGTLLSYPTNKVRFVANYLKIPFEFRLVNLRQGEQRKPEYLKINPLGKIPAINDDGFTLAESNAIMRYLANKFDSPIYPHDIKQRAHVDQWIDYSSIHVMLSFARIMFNTYFYKLAGTERDERSLQEGRKFVSQYLPILDQQLSKNKFIASDNLSLADFALLTAVDPAEVAEVDLTPFPHITEWRKNLMSQQFYQACHVSFTDIFNKLMRNV